ncbi:hypothetical protein DMI70_02325 [Escherichia coli]|nr:hypothetical protein [Escherichia coli]
MQTTGSSRGTGNETNYVMQNLRAPLLVPITLTAALVSDTAHRLQVCNQSVGNGAMSNAINEIDNTDLVFVFGYNPADSPNRGEPRN